LCEWDGPISRRKPCARLAWNPSPAQRLEEALGRWLESPGNDWSIWKLIDLSRAVRLVLGVSFPLLMRIAVSMQVPHNLHRVLGTYSMSYLLLGFMVVVLFIDD
jgi:hypothetical protein